MATIKQAHFSTSDGVRLSYLDPGRGPAVVLLTGWSQAAEHFRGPENPGRFNRAVRGFLSRL